MSVVLLFLEIDRRTNSSSPDFQPLQHLRREATAQNDGADDEHQSRAEQHTAHVGGGVPDGQGESNGAAEP